MHPPGASGGFAGSDFVGAGGVDVECPDDWRLLQEGRQDIVDFRIRFTVISLSVLFAIPEAETDDAIWLSVRD
jgi:hypothetical protein